MRPTQGKIVKVPTVDRDCLIQIGLATIYHIDDMPSEVREAILAQASNIMVGSEVSVQMRQQIDAICERFGRLMS